MALLLQDCVGFQAQVASIIELLANSAVAEICKLVDDGYAALRSQMEQERERGELKVREMELKMRSMERRIRRRSQREEERGQFLLRATEATCANLAVLDTPPLPTSPDDPVFPQLPQCTSQEVGGAMSLVKLERAERGDCDLDLKVEVNIRAECGLASEGELDETSDSVMDSNMTSSPGPPTAQSSSPSSDATMDLTCRPRQRRKTPKPLGGGTSVAVGAGLADMVLKPEIPTDDGDEEDEEDQDQLEDGELSPERLSSLGLDLAWMQERVSHLGAAFAVAQLGLNSDPAAAHSSFPAGGGGAPQGGDGLEAPPPNMLFPGAAHEMAAFAASFDIAGGAPPPGDQRPPPSFLLKEPTVCSVCGRVFPSGAALELHQRVHGGGGGGGGAGGGGAERPFSCPHCGKGFAQPNNLRVHLLIHSGERRYRCNLCGKSFISSSHLKRHRTVHTQEKPYACARCGQSFSQMCSVRRHRQQSQCGL